MVKIGIVVEGHSEKIFVESTMFQTLCRELDIQVIDTLNAGGNGNLCCHNIQPYVTQLQTDATIQTILVLADLDPETCAPCITKRKERMGASPDHIVIARNAIEAWFLADYAFLQNQFSSEVPIQTARQSESEPDPFHKLKELNQLYKNGRGLNNKKQFMKRNSNRLNLQNAAQHASSAAYLLTTLQQIADQTE